MPHLSPCVEIPFPVSCSVGSLWFSLNVCAIEHLINPTIMSVLHRDGTGCFHCSTGGLHIGELPCIGC